MTVGPKLTGSSKLGATPGGGVAAGIVQRSTPGGIEAIVGFGAKRSNSGGNKGRMQAPVAGGSDLFQYYVTHVVYVLSTCWAFLTSKLHREPYLPKPSCRSRVSGLHMYVRSCRSGERPPKRPSTRPEESSALERHPGPGLLGPGPGSAYLQDKYNLGAN
jgi:hypothetical protein